MTTEALSAEQQIIGKNPLVQRENTLADSPGTRKPENSFAMLAMRRAVSACWSTA
jgi:hypothetical protein